MEKDVFDRRVESVLASVWFKAIESELNLAVSSVSVDADLLGFVGVESVFLPVISGQKDAVVRAYRAILDNTEAFCDQDHLPVLLHVKSEIVASQTPVLGVIGGMGPGATMYFVSMIEADLPMLILSNTQIPNRTDVIMGKSKYSFVDIQERLRLSHTFLSARGATRFSMPCNTAHFFADCLPNLFHLIEETATYLNAEYSQRAILILGTSGTLKAGVFQKALIEKGHPVFVPSDSEQSFLMSVIDGVKSNRLDLNWDAKMTSLVDAYRQKEPGLVVVLGCTELPLFFGRSSLGALGKKVVFVDPMVVLSQQISRSCLS
jgi:aspartate racemase